MKPIYSLAIFFIFIYASAQIQYIDNTQTLDHSLSEISGSVFFENYLYAISDSGNKNALHKLDPETGKVIKSIFIQNSENYDWESLAQDEDYIYIGDIGNNSGNRENLAIYRVAKKDLHQSSVPSEKIEFIYENQFQFNNIFNKHNFDAEAMIVVNEQVYIFTKNWKDQESSLYTFPAKIGKQMATFIGNYDVKGLVTGADYHQVRNMVALVGYSETYQPFIVEIPNFINEQGYAKTFKKHKLPYQVGQWVPTESINWKNDSELYVSNEILNYEIMGEPFKLPAQLHNFRFKTNISQDASENLKLTLYPNPTTNNVYLKSSQLLVEVDIYDSNGRRMPKPEINENSVNVDDLSEGVYFVKAQSEKGEITKKMIVR